MPLVSVKDAALILGVSEQTVRNHHKGGRLAAASEEPLQFDPEHVRAAKLLNPSDLGGEAHGISQEELVGAKLDGVVAPNEDGRYSLADVDTIHARRIEPTPAPAKGRGIGDLATVTAAGGANIARVSAAGAIMRARPTSPGSLADMLVHYLRHGESPNALPDEFWLTPAPPKFVPPLNTCREVVQSFISVGHGAAQRWRVLVWRSGYWWLNETGKLVWRKPRGKCVDADPDVDEPTVGQPRSTAKIGNERWRLARNEWLLAWERRQPNRAARRGGAGGGAGGNLKITEDPVDREAILLDYHMFYEHPGDLPPEFWQGEEMPPFEPPTNFGHYKLGKCFWEDKENTRPRTSVIRSAGWHQSEDDLRGPVWMPEEIYGSVAGHVSEHPEIDVLNAPLNGARRDWKTAWQKYRALCEEFG